MTARTVYHDVIEERVKQIKEAKDADHDNGLDGLDWIALVQAQLNRAGIVVRNGEDPTIDSFRDRMVKVAALAVAAVEAHDRIMEGLGN